METRLSEGLIGLSMAKQYKQNEQPKKLIRQEINSLLDLLPEEELNYISEFIIDRAKVAMEEIKYAIEKYEKFKEREGI